MRVSVDSSDPGFTGPNPRLIIWLDGVEVRDVITADEDQGFVVKHYRDESGSIVIDRVAGETLRETLRGAVKITERQ